MRIAIDCRKIDDFGIGATIRGLLGGIVSIDADLEIIALAPSRARRSIPEDRRIMIVDESSPGYSIRELFSVGRRAERSGADLLHIPHYVVPWTSLPIVATIHDLIHLRVARRHLPPGGRLYARWMIGRAVSRAARIVTVTDAVREEIAERFPGATSKIVTVPNGVSIEPPREERPGRIEEPYLLFVGNDKPHKNVDRLVEAFGELRRDHAGLRLVLVGSAFERFRETRGVVLPGFVPEEELAHLYAGATALVQPSLYEGFGLPVAEAMRCGTAVVVSSIPPLLEVAGEAAIPIDDPRSVSSIRQGLVRALDPEERRRSVRAGETRSAGMTWARAATTTVDLWRAVFAERSR
jgi:glycosyltransferase involved in cell wall biosynthesis